LPLFDGFRQYHIARLEAGESLTWPEVEAKETEEIRAQLASAFGTD
jgi:hypothetical protein